MTDNDLNERAGLVLAQTAIDTGMNYREFKKWLKAELNAVDAEADTGYTELTINSWDDAWPAYDR